MSLEEKEHQVKALIAQDKKDQAVKLLFEMVVTCANAKEFQRAEDYRKQIMLVNSLALTEIISAAEIIESEKAKAIDTDHKKNWSGIYDKLSDEEANDLYFVLKKISLKPGKMIMQQGRINNRLFLVDKGILNVIHEQDKRQLFLKEITTGEPAGFKTFFNISYATTTIVTKGTVVMHYLERRAMDNLFEKHPGLDAKLETLFGALVKEKMEEILNAKSLERRRYKRFNSSGKVVAFMLDDKARPGGTPIHGMLEDISQGGLSFTIRQSKKQTARLLLGRQAALNIHYEDSRLKTAKNGRVTSVYNQLFNNWLVNFKFTKPLTPNKVMELIVSE